jgi:hypothetical protein
MPEPVDDPPVVRMPERMDRRLRLGPFPSGRDAIKFLTYAAAGAVVAPFVSPFLWLPLVGVGFGLAVWHPDGRPIDARLLTFVHWKVRSFARGGGLNPRWSAVTRHGIVRLSSSRHAAVIRTGGCPVAYLPPTELARRFELYRDLLRATEGRLTILASIVPIRVAPLLPPSSSSKGADDAAREGYLELVRLLCRRRSLRRIYFALATDATAPEALAQLEGEVASMVERLTGFGLHPVRLTDRALQEASFRFEWSHGEAGG